MSDETRREFLGAAAAAAGLPLTDAAGDGEQDTEAPQWRPGTNTFQAVTHVPPSVAEEARERLAAAGGDPDDVGQLDQYVLEQLETLELVYPSERIESGARHDHSRED